MENWSVERNVSMKKLLGSILNFRNWPVFWKISLMPMLAVGLIMIGVFFYVLPLTKHKLTEDKENNVTDVVKVAYNLIAEYDSRAARGEFSRGGGPEAGQGKDQEFQIWKK